MSWDTASEIALASVIIVLGLLGARGAAPLERQRLPDRDDGVYYGFHPIRSPTPPTPLGGQKGAGPAAGEGRPNLGDYQQRKDAR